MSDETKEYTGVIEAINKTEGKPTGFKIGDDWYNSTKKTEEEMNNNFEKGQTVTMAFFENESNGRVYRNVVGIKLSGGDAIPEEAIEVDSSLGTAKPAPKEAKKPAAVPDKYAKYVIDIKGKSFIQAAGLMAMAHDEGLQGIHVKDLVADNNSAHCIVECKFKDGRVWEGCGSANPENLGTMVKAYPVEMAETRAIGRALRRALNIDMVSAEESTSDDANTEGTSDQARVHQQRLESGGGDGARR